MENLKSNIIILLIIEIIISIILINTNFGHFTPFFIISAFSINTTSAVLLIKYKPRGYLFLLLLILAIIIIPVFYFFYIISNIHC